MGNTTLQVFKDLPQELGQAPADPVRDPSKLETLQVGFGGRVLRVDRNGIWLGSEKFADAPFKVDMNGNITATSLDLSNFLEIGEALGDIGAGNITGTYIANGAIITSKLAAEAVTAAKIDVDDLFAQTITATGSITGARIRTSSTGSRVELSSSADSIKIYNSSNDIRLEIYDNIISFNDSSEVRVATVYASDGGNFLIDASNQASSSILINAGASGAVTLGTDGNVYVSVGSGAVDFGTYIDMNGYDIEMNDGDITGLRRLDFDTSHSTNPASEGRMVYHSSSTSFRCRVNSTLYQFSLFEP